jgi:predicted NBD/HSP70 family sugar kinase
MISGPGIAKRILNDVQTAKALQKQPGVEKLARLAASGRPSKVIDELVRLAEQDQVSYAQRLIDDITMHAGRALGSAAASFDPDCIVVEGYVFRDRPTLMRRLWQAANACFRPGGQDLVRLTPAMLGPSAKFISLITFVGDSQARAGKLTG